MNCPYCNKPLYHPIGKPTLSCQNWGCMATDNIIGNHSAWEKIIQLKSQLEIAVDALKMIGSGKIIEHSVVGHEDDNKIFIANKALEQITALEQKE